MLAQIFDTETTGLFNFKRPPGDASQPEVLQLCSKLSLDGKIVSSINLFVHGEKSIEEKAFETHRIDRKMTERIGTTRRRMIFAFLSHAEKADVIVGHNVNFDVKMLISEMIREGGHGDIFQRKAISCTMKESTALCKIPKPSNPSAFKWPSLPEAYSILVDPRGFSNAHDAEADVDACHAVFRVIQSRIRQAA